VQIRVERSATGVTEETRLALPRSGSRPDGSGGAARLDRDGSGGAARLDRDASAPADGPVVDVLGDLARRQRVLLATAWRSGGHPDGTLAARQRGMPVPLGAVVGAAAVRDLGVDPATLPDGASVVGPARVPSLLLDFAPPEVGLTGGAEVEARWRRLAVLGTALGPRATSLLGFGDAR
jgi:hypothetical protein